MYYAFLQGGASRISLNKNELCLCRANQSRDLVKIAIVVAKYTSSSTLSIRIPHLEREEVFGSTIHKANLPPRLEADSHSHDRMNFFLLKVAITIARILQQSVVDVGEGNNTNPIVTHNGAKIFECLYGDDVWQI